MSSQEYEFFVDIFKYQGETDLLEHLKHAYCPESGAIDWSAVWGEPASMSTSLARISRMIYANHGKRNDDSQMRLFQKYLNRVIKDRDRRSFKSFNWRLFALAVKLMYEIPGDILNKDKTPNEETLAFLKEAQVGWSDISEFFVVSPNQPGSVAVEHHHGQKGSGDHQHHKHGKHGDQHHKHGKHGTKH